jgi:hypothetical protein
VSTWSAMLWRSQRPNSVCSSMSRPRQGRRAWIRSPSQVIGAIEQQEMDVSHPAAAGQSVQMLRYERTEQNRRHPGLSDAMGHCQPRVTKGRPPDRLITAELAGRVEEPVDVEGAALAPQTPGERNEYGRLSRTRCTRHDEQRPDRGSIGAPALRADSESIPRLHDDRAVA